MNLTGQGIYQKGQQPVKAAPKRMKHSRRPAIVCEPGKMFVSAVLRQFAKGKECQMKSEWCNGDMETTALCHSRRLAGAGGGQKPHDFWGYHGCSGCHANEEHVEFKELYVAIRRTQDAVFAEFGTLTPTENHND